MRYDKLVRDRIIEIIRADGREPVFHAADEAEYRTKLKEKLREEVEEFVKDETVGEIADILEVVEAVAAIWGFSPDEIAKTKREKTEKRGAFRDRIILEES